MEYRWNDTDTGNKKHWQEILSNYHFVHMSHIYWPGIEPGLSRLEADDKPLEPRYGRTPLKTLSKQRINLWSLPHREHCLLTY